MLKASDSNALARSVPSALRTETVVSRSAFALLFVLKASAENSRASLSSAVLKREMSVPRVALLSLIWVWRAAFPSAIWVRRPALASLICVRRVALPSLVSCSYPALRPATSTSAPNMAC